MRPVVRPLQLTDLPDVGALFERMFREDGEWGYPLNVERTPTQIVTWLGHDMMTAPEGWSNWVAVLEPETGAFGEVAGGKVVGVVIAQRHERRVGNPSEFIVIEWIYTVPELRGHTRVALDLLFALHEDGQRRWPNAAWEGCYVPGSHAEKIWTKLGMRPYGVRCVMMNPKGQLTHDWAIHQRHKRRAARLKE